VENQLVHRADKLVPFVVRLSSNLRACNLQSLCRAVQELLYLYLYLVQLILSEMGIRSMRFRNLLFQNLLELL